MNDHSPVLVIGATGFLGRHIVAALRDGGRPVRAIVWVQDIVHT